MTTERSNQAAALDDAQIRNLIARIAQLADTGTAKEYARCFTADAHWEMPGAARHGRADIIAGSLARRESGDIGPDSATRHAVGTIVVTLQGDTAQATSYFQFFTHTTTAPQLRQIGQYDDHFVRSAAGWLLNHRRITLG